MSTLFYSSRVPIYPYDLTETLKTLDKPDWLRVENISYLTLMGSLVYGANVSDTADVDIYGFVVPPPQVVFPMVRGEIPGFGNQVEQFGQWNDTKVDMPPLTLDFSIYNIVKYFQLCMDGNPNMIDSLFTEKRFHIKVDKVWRLIEQKKELFLSQRCWSTFRGMLLFSHWSRIKSGYVRPSRIQLKEEYGFDTKDAYHTVRIMLEIEQILKTGTLLLSNNSDYLKEVRLGKIPLSEISELVAYKLNDLEVLSKSDYVAVPRHPNQEAIKELLVECLETYYNSSLSNFTYPSYF